MKSYRLTPNLVATIIGTVLGVTFALGTVWGHAGHGVEVWHIVQDALLSLLVVYLFGRGITMGVLSETFAGFKTTDHKHERQT